MNCVRLIHFLTFNWCSMRVIFTIFLLRYSFFSYCILIYFRRFEYSIRLIMWVTDCQRAINQKKHMLNNWTKNYNITIFNKNWTKKYNIYVWVKMRVRWKDLTLDTQLKGKLIYTHVQWCGRVIGDFPPPLPVHWILKDRRKHVIDRTKEIRSNRYEVRITIIHT